MQRTNPKPAKAFWVVSVGRGAAGDEVGEVGRGSGPSTSLYGAYTYPEVTGDTGLTGQICILNRVPQAAAKRINRKRVRPEAGTRWWAGMMVPTRNERAGARTAFAGLVMRKWPWKILRAKKKKKQMTACF